MMGILYYPVPAFEAKLPRISDIEIVEKNAERIVITWKLPYATEVSILVVISCLNCQKDEAVYVPGNILSGSRFLTPSPTSTPHPVIVA
ncbi:hypothetical protein ACTXT7_011369 [Hymenolepis weldensis]